MNNYEFGNYLYELRTKKNLTQNELAKILGVTNKAVSKWETGAAYPQTKLIYPLAKALGVTVEDLYVAMSDNEKNKGGIRKALDSLFKNKKLALITPIISAIVIYILFVLFYQGADKSTLLILTPIVSAIAYAGIYLVFFIQLKNPMCPSRFLDVFELLALIVFGLGSVTNLISFITNMNENFSVIICIGMIVWSVVSLIHNKRKD